MLTELYKCCLPNPSPISFTIPHLGKIIPFSNGLDNGTIRHMNIPKKIGSTYLLDLKLQRNFITKD